MVRQPESRLEAKLSTVHRSQWRPRLLGRETILPLLVFLFTATMAVTLWWQLDSGEGRWIQVETEVTAEQVRLRLEAWIDARAAIVEHLAGGRHSDLAGSQQSFVEEAARFLEAFSGFKALNWIDGGWVIRITVPPEGNEQALNKDLHFHPDPGVVPAITLAAESGRITRSPVVDLLQGEKGFATYRLVHDATGQPTGFVNGVFLVQTLVDNCLAEKDLHERFRYCLHEEDWRPVHGHDAGEQDHHSWPFQAEVRVRAVDKPWILVIAPSPALLAGYRTLVDEFMLAASLLLAALLAWLFHVALQRQRAIQLRNEQMGLLLGAVKRLNTELVVPSVMRELVSTALALVGAGSGAAGLMRQGAMVFTEYDNGGTIQSIALRFLPGEGVPGHIINTRRPYLSNDAASDPHVIQEVREALKFRNLVDVPIIGRSGDLLGCFEIHNTVDGRPFDQQDVQLLEGLAGQASVALDNALLKNEQERLEDQLRHSQKMEAIGLLAGGVAHDFNNLLQAVLGHAELALSDLGNDEQVKFSLEQVARGGERAAELTAQLLAFSRQQVLSPITLDLNDVIAGLLKLIQRGIGEDIELEFNPGHNLGAVNADPGQMEQVLMNLCVNARDAMPGGGRVVIETRNVEVDCVCCATHQESLSGPHVLLSISDTGHGMNETVRKQIFEPFFTTKEVGRGTGLGLATVYGIVSQHGGCIGVESEPGRGTIFRICLPRVESEVQVMESAVEGPVVGGSETVLIAEDEEMVRAYAVRVLEAAGYTVIQAADGAEALDLFSRHRNEIEVCILDVVMPKMNGRELFDRVREIRPGIRVLFASGFSQDAIHTRFIIHEGLELLRKPFNRSDLLRRLRQTLERGQDRDPAPA
jgi:signal transduction histidine kinase/sensor domain CHASE-containing protein/ActR/RegA family two-component response regulator